MDRRVLRDDPWDRIKDMLPGKAGDCGVTAKDHRLFVEAVPWIGRTGAPWRELPGGSYRQSSLHGTPSMFGLRGGAKQVFGNVSRLRRR